MQNKNGQRLLIHKLRSGLGDAWRSRAISDRAAGLENIALADGARRGCRKPAALFAGRSLVLRVFPYPPANEVSDLLLLKQKEWGALGVAMTVMLIGAARNPLRNCVIVWAMTVGLVVAGVAELVSVWALDSAKLYPVPVTVGHAVIRLLFAVLLLCFLTWARRDTGSDRV